MERKRKFAAQEGVLEQAQRKNDLIEVHNATRIFEKDLSKIDDEDAREYYSLVRSEYLQNMRQRTAKRKKMAEKKKNKRRLVLYDDDAIEYNDDDNDNSLYRRDHGHGGSSNNKENIDNARNNMEEDL